MGKQRVNGRDPAPPQQTVREFTPLTVITHPQFNWDVQRDEQGNSVLVITKPDFTQHVFPFGVQAARKCGMQMAAPSIEVPT